MKSLKFWSAVLTVLVLSGLLATATAFTVSGQETTPPPAVQVGEVAYPSLSPVMGNVVYEPSVRKLDREEINPMKNPGLFLPDLGLTGTNTKAVDPLVAGGLGVLDAPSPLLSFEGQGDLNMYAPPDTTGDVGPNHFIQMVNVDTAVYDKSGNFITHWSNNQLWDGFGGPCENDNDGDPVVLYDDMADRWVLTQFTYSTGNGECFAVSTTPDPLGTYYRYYFVTPDFPDYPKIGVWPDGYYMGTNSGYPNQYYAHVVDRQAMLNGDPAGYQYVGGQGNFLMPNDADGSTPPPAGEPGVFYTFFDGGYPNHPAGVDRIALFEFDVDWVTPANSTFGLVQELPIADFNYTTCGFFVRDCIPQLGTTMHLDAVDPWPMVRLQYRNLNSYQAMVGNFTVDVDGSDHAGIRWFELRKTGAAWDLYQEGTWAPDANHRFMGSIAMDGSGNIALGYSISSATMYPSIRYTVHANGDALGTMQAEAELMAGLGSQTGLQRWGDYSATVVDPVDDCTFWITNEYHDTTNDGFNWDSRIGTFRVPGCTGSVGYVGTLEGTVTDASTTNPIEGASVEATLSVTQTFASTTDVNGDYSAQLPVGIYDVTASAFGYQPQTVSGVEVISGSVTTQNFALNAAVHYLVEGYVYDANTGWPLYASIAIDGYPSDPIWTDPVTGYYSISLPEGVEYTFNVSAFVNGYVDDSRVVGPLTADTTEDFALDADMVACNAPGYALDYAYVESFEANNGGYTHSGTQDEWEWGAPITWPSACSDGTNCWGTDLDGTYNNSANFSLVSPVINMPAEPSLMLTWDQAWYLESATWDHAYAEVSINGGAYQTMWSHTGGTTQQGWQGFSYDVSAASGGTLQLRFRLTSDSSVVYDGYYIDNLSIALDCVAPTGGLVVGNVYDDNTNAPLVGALVANEDGGSTLTVVTPDDPAVNDGFYVLYANDSQNFTASMDGGYVPDTAAVTIFSGDTVLQDFNLGAGWLEVTPAGLHATLELGVTDTLQLDLSNLGVSAAAFEISEQDGGFVPVFRTPKRSVVIGDLPFTTNPNAASSPTPFELAPLAPDAMMLTHSASQTITPGNSVSCNAGGLHTDNSYIRKFDLEAFGITGGFDVTNVQVGIETAAGAGGSQPATVNLYTWDSTTPFTFANFVLVGTADTAINDQAATILDIPVTGSAPAGTYLVVEFFTPDGQADGHSLFVGSNAMGQTDYTYLTAADCGVTDPTPTGDIGFPNMHLVMNVIGDVSGGVPWLAEEPVTGTIASLDNQIIDVTFDAGVPEVNQPGDYLATLRFANDTPYGTLLVPVTMTVNVPATYGKIAGTVTGLGYCDDDPAALEGAQVVIVGATGTITLTTDAAGYYSFWLDASEAPLSISVTAAEHADGVATGVLLTAGETTTANFNLRWLMACTASEPAAMEVTVVAGYSTTLSMSLTNGGAVDTAFLFIEKDNGYAPPPVLRGEPYNTPAASQSKLTSQGLNLPAAPVAAPLAAGDVIQSWPTGLTYGWGMGYNLSDGDLWVGDIGAGGGTDLAYRYLTDGTDTGDTFDISWAGVFAADMTYNPNTGMLWVLDVGGDNCIHEVDPSTQTVTGNTICPAFGASERGLAYDPETDTYFAGGWNDLMIYRFAPDGSILDSVNTGLSTAGLAFNPDTQHLFVMVNADPNPVVVLDVADNYNVVGQFTITGFGAYSGAGFEMDCDGALWAVNQDTQTVYQAESDETTSMCGSTFKDTVLWVSENPVTGTLAADSDLGIDITFDASVPEVAYLGQYFATLSIKTDDPINPKYAMPVTMTVVAADFGVSVAPSLDMQLGTPGTTVVYSVTVTNNGNVSDTFDVALSGNDWTTTAPVTVGPLAPGASTTVAVEVEIPADAAIGSFDAVSVTVTSQGDPTETASASLVTTCVEIVYELYLPLLWRLP